MSPLSWPLRVGSPPLSLLRLFGCLFLCIGSALFGGLTWWMNSTLDTDPEGVLSRARDVLPALTPIPGQVGLFSLDSGGRVLSVFGDPSLALGSTGPIPFRERAPLLALQALEDPSTSTRAHAERLRQTLVDRGYLEPGSGALQETLTALPPRGSGRQLTRFEAVDRRAWAGSLKVGGVRVLLHLEGAPGDLQVEALEALLGGLEGLEEIRPLEPTQAPEAG